MKKTLLLSLNMILLFSSLNLRAQQHNVKLDLSSLTSTELRLNYEFLINEKSSVVVIAGTMIPHKIPGLIYNTSVLEAEYGGDISLENRFSGFTLGAQFRFYTKAEAQEGFYLAPYLKYHKYSISTSALFSDNITEAQYQDLNEAEKEHATFQSTNNYLYKNTGILEGSLSRFGGGLALGYQWILNDVVSIDWTFFGLGIEQLNASMEVSANSENYSPDYQEWADEIDAEAQEFFFIGEKLDIDVQEDRIKVSYPFIFPLPYASLTIGYCF